MELDLELAKLILEQLNGAVLSDSEGRYLYVSKSWVKKIGKEPEEVLGKKIKDVFPDTKIDLMLDTKKPLIGELFRHDDKQDPTGFMNYLPIMKDDQVLGGLIFSIFPDMDVAMKFRQKLDNLSQELDYYKEELRKIRSTRYTIDNIIGTSEAILKMKDQILRAARSNSTVLIEGETGTGKELVAHAVHNASQRNCFNFIKINCAAIPGELLESEFFGYDEGAFSGAKKGGKKGKFEVANSGSIFLDEVNQMPLTLQPKILRVLQEKEIERVGGGRSIDVDVRIIAATNEPLEKLVAEKKFRSDLFYRLNVIRITVPPLRERREDIPLLVEGLLKRLNFQLGVKVKEVSPRMIELLQSYDWPGNVRELQNTLERVMNMTWDSVLEEEHFDWFLKAKGINPKGKHKLSPPSSLMAQKLLTEKDAIADALQMCNGNKVQAARLLNISRTMLYRKLRKHGL